MKLARKSNARVAQSDCGYESRRHGASVQRRMDNEQETRRANMMPIVVAASGSMMTNTIAAAQLCF
jgi:hypothetical protein